MNTVNIEQSNRNIESFGGLCLMQALINGHRLPDSFYNEQGKTGDANVLFSMLGLLYTGHSSFADINHFQKNPHFKFFVGISRIPTEVALRQNLDRLAQKESTFEALDALNL